MTKKDVYRCHSCGEEIKAGEEYFTLCLNRERMEKDGGIVMLSAQEIRNWCSKCWDELHIILKTSISELGSGFASSHKVDK